MDGQTTAPRSGFVGSLLNAIVLVAIGAGIAVGYHAFDIKVPPRVQTAEITGPDRIEYAGQLALFRASVPGKSPKDLIYTWGVESVGVNPVTYAPDLVSTSNAGETQLTTVAGRWRLWCAISDPSSRTGQMLSRTVDVPGRDTRFAEAGSFPTSPQTGAQPATDSPARAIPFAGSGESIL